MTEVKICGLVRKEDVEAANAFRPDYVGFVLFFPKSKRNLSLTQAAALKDRLDPGIRSVAVTVSPTAGQAKQIEEAGFDMIQIHGELDQEVYDILSIPILRACNVKDGEDPELQLSPLPSMTCNNKITGYVLDSKNPGSGKTFDWSLLADSAWREKLMERGQKLILAGGINEENVEEAIRVVKPDVIDLSSSVELADKPEDNLGDKLAAAGSRSRGKDPEKMRIMIRKVHDAE